MSTNIISVKYEDNYVPKTFCGKSYSYFTAVKVNIGDLVIAPTVKGNKIARVSEIDVPEYKVEHIKTCLRLITDKINKEKYLENAEVLREVA